MGVCTHGHCLSERVPRFRSGLLRHGADMYIADIAFTEFPPFESQIDQTDHNRDKHDSPLQFTFEEQFEDLHNTHKSDMAGSGSPFIKPEPNDFFNFNNFNSPLQGNGFNMNTMNNYHNGGMNGNGIDPSQLGQNGSMPGSYGQNNMSGSFMMGNAGIDDDELADLAGSLGNGHNFPDHGMNQQQNFYNGGMNMPQQQQNNMNIYSNTPEGAPIQSPFVNHDGFNYGQFRSGNQLATSGNFTGSGSLMRAQQIQNMERKISESRSPASPRNNAAISNLHIGEPEYSIPMQPQMMNHRHSASMSNGFDGSRSQSWGDPSQFGSSPSHSHQLQHAQISEVLRSDQGRASSSVPKVEPGMSGPPYVTQEAKKRRRRESHNLVERRRRDNINERIQDLAMLVPQHRLEDDKVRKHLQTNSPLSPSITAANMSPPSNSLLSTSGSRRAAGSITQGLPLEDKDKGPNKGDILNSSVAWSRDVLWYMQKKLEQEEKLKALVHNLGGVWPFEMTDDEHRMHSEITEVLERNLQNNNILPYSRANGTGLRVPGYTNLAGDAVSGEGLVNYNGGQSISPGMQSSSSGGANASWMSQGVFKEEEEFDEDML